MDGGWAVLSGCVPFCIALFHLLHLVGPCSLCACCLARIAYGYRLYQDHLLVDRFTVLTLPCVPTLLDLLLAWSCSCQTMGTRFLVGCGLGHKRSISFWTQARECFTLTNQGGFTSGCMVFGHSRWYCFQPYGVFPQSQFTQPSGGSWWKPRPK